MSLSETCMLVSVSVPVWSCERNDKRVAKAAAEKWGSNLNSVRGGKCLIDPDSLKPVSKKAGEARTRNYALTLPWNDRGDRVIHRDGFDGWKDEMARFKREFESLAMEFADQYPRLVEDAKSDLNGLFLASDYPSPAAILSKFSFTTKIQNVPNSDDFRVQGLADSEVQAIRASIEADVHNTVSAAMGDVSERIRSAVSHMMTGLRKYDDTDKKATRFHDTLVENVRSLVSVLPALNLTGDRRIREIADDMNRKLCKWEAESLRANETARIQVSDAAESVLRRMDGLGL